MEACSRGIFPFTAPSTSARARPPLSASSRRPRPARPAARRPPSSTSPRRLSTTWSSSSLVPHPSSSTCGRSGVSRVNSSARCWRSWPANRAGSGSWPRSTSMPIRASARRCRCRASPWSSRSSAVSWWTASWALCRRRRSASGSARSWTRPSNSASGLAALAGPVGPAPQGRSQASSRPPMGTRPAARRAPAVVPAAPVPAPAVVPAAPVPAPAVVPAAPVPARCRPRPRCRWPARSRRPGTARWSWRARRAWRTGWPRPGHGPGNVEPGVRRGPAGHGAW